MENVCPTVLKSLSKNILVHYFNISWKSLYHNKCPKILYSDTKILHNPPQQIIGLVKNTNKDYTHSYKNYGWPIKIIKGKWIKQFLKKMCKSFLKVKKTSHP